MYTPNQQTVHRTQLRKQSDSVTSAPDCALSHFMHCTYVLTTRSKVLLQKLTGFQLVKKFPTFYGTRRFITSFTTAHHMFLSQASSIQSIPPTSHFLKIHLKYYPPIYAWVFQVVSFPQVSPPKSCIRLSSPSYMLHAPHISAFSI